MQQPLCGATHTATLSPPSNNAVTASAAIGSGAGALQVSAANQGASGNGISIVLSASSDGDANNFKLQVLYGATLAKPPAMWLRPMTT